MADIFSKDKRSEVMSKIRGKNTSVELLVFRYLRKEGVYFQRHYKRAPGSPDIALPRKKRAVFIDGDFWHGRTVDRLIERRGKEDFWTKKILRNIERDKETMMSLRSLGWQVMSIWESDLKKKSTQEVASRSIKKFLVESS